MSFFGGLFKILKGVPGIGNVVNAVEGVVEAGGSLLHHKQPMVKPMIAPKDRGQMSSADIASNSPVMPGGGVATPGGVMGRTAGTPPHQDRKSVV